jgi:hypothetical protein
MSELIWLALICAITYAVKPMLPDYLDLTKHKRTDIDVLRDALNDQERTVFAIVRANEKMQRRIEELEQRSISKAELSEGAENQRKYLHDQALKKGGGI